MIRQTISWIFLENNEYQGPHQAIRQSGNHSRVTRQKSTAGGVENTARVKNGPLRRDTRLRAPRKRVIQILYSIMQINMRRIKLSLEFVGRGEEKGGVGEPFGEIFMFLRKQKSAGANLSRSLLGVSSLESDSPAVSPLLFGSPMP